ncbi:hypothetical protein [Streptomyces ortus]|uniref:Transposase n=1 Tax=Streptomyces ortus TaxID=2867268 RepID=A0ABT3UX10_9ACTN|nr:hypothetical protein [Streptomyces ortus]MCX4232105.1 hypothetical protein [Streptomyces ortus]
MTFTDLMPIRIARRERPVRRHRAPDECARLRFLLFGANLCIRGLRLQLDDQDRDHAATIARIDERHAEVVTGLESEVAELQRRLDIACRAETAVTRTQEISLDEIRRHCVKPLHQAPFATAAPGWAPTAI